MDKKLFRRAKAGDIEARNAIVEAHLDILDYHARREASKRGLDGRELMTAAFLGLSQAIDGFDPDNGARFKTYASHRVRGEILDQARRESPLTLSGMRLAKALSDAEMRISQQLGRAATIPELESEIGSEHLDSALKARNWLSNTSLDAIDVEPRTRRECLDNDRAYSFAREVRSELSGRRRELFEAVYIRGETMLEAAKRHGVSESRVCGILRDIREKIVRIIHETGSVKGLRRTFGQPAVPPYGYSVDFYGGRLEPDESVIVRLIFIHYSRGRIKTATSVAKWMNRNRYVSERRPKWNPSNVLRILRDRVYLGFDDRWPRVVSDERFDAATRRLPERQGRRAVAS